MPSIFAKLNLRDQSEILVARAPQTFEPKLRTLEGVAVLRGPVQAAATFFALVFVNTQAALDDFPALLATRAQGDAVLWFACPKQVAIDEDWSALRFRRAEYLGRAGAQ